MSKKNFAQGEIVTIGRSAECECIVGDDARVSRLHLALVAVGGMVSVRDLNSTNGTFLNGRRMTRCVLQPGDRLTIGIATEIVWSVNAETSMLVLSLKPSVTDQGEGQNSAVGQGQSPDPAVGQRLVDQAAGPGQVPAKDVGPADDRVAQ